MSIARKKRLDKVFVMSSFSHEFYQDKHKPSLGGDIMLECMAECKESCLLLRLAQIFEFMLHKVHCCYLLPQL